jgi:hypothetical protein
MGVFRPPCCEIANAPFLQRATISLCPSPTQVEKRGQFQLDIHRSISGEERLLLAFEMSMFARELSWERIRSEHPEWPDERIARELSILALLRVPLPGL